MSKAIASDCDVNVTYEDQQYINQFARNNAKLQEVKDEIEAKKKELQNLDDASDELLMLDEEDPIPFFIGEVFMVYPHDETNTMLEETKTTIQAELASMEEKSEALSKLLADLKAKLYAKFGNNINLEMEEES